MTKKLNSNCTTCLPRLSAELKITFIEKIEFDVIEVWNKYPNTVHNYLAEFT